MAFADREELLEHAADFLERDSVTQASACLAMCEAELNRKLRHREMMERATNATISSEYETLPSDFLQDTEFWIVGDTRPLKPATVSQIALMALANTATGRPTHYHIIGTEARFWPTPDQTYSAVLIYLQKVPALTDDDDTNWLLAKAPDIYLNGILKYAGVALRDELKNDYAAMFANGIAQLNAEYKPRPGKLVTEIAAMMPRGGYDITRDA